MKILLLSDTHGNLQLVNSLLDKTGADIVVHAGDFGFYDDKSVDRLSERELHLLVVHSDKVPHSEKRGDVWRTVEKYRLLGDFPEMLSRDFKFKKPVYAVWGNHEDADVVRLLRSGDYEIPNLHIIDENNSYILDDLFLFGLGGNVLAGRKLFDRELAGYGGKVWSTLEQFGKMLALTEDVQDVGMKMFVSHVSPGKEPLLLRMMMHVAPEFMVSGHMGPPHATVWNQFAIHPTEQSLYAWLEANSQGYRSTLDVARHHDLTENQERALSYLETRGHKTLRGKRGAAELECLRKMWTINLPDAKVGYAILSIGHNHRYGFDTFTSNHVK